MKSIRCCLWFLAASVLMLLVPIAQADTRIIGTATGSGIIPSGTYAGLRFTVSYRMEYSDYGRESLTGGKVVVTITTGSGVERFDNYVRDDGDVGGVREEREFSFTGNVEHNGHRHLIAGSAEPPNNYLSLNIYDQTGTVFEPPAPALACDPGIVGIELYDAIVSITPGALPVVVDIKPGSFPNAVNPKARGVIPVAILSTETFDATTVDPLTVAFGPAGATETHGKGHPEDVNRDGKLDLVFHFKTEETGIQSGDVSAGLTGMTLTGQEIAGSDAIVTVGGGSKGLAQDAPFELAQEESGSGPLSLRAYPNPFNPSTVIQYALPKDDVVSLKLYNSVGAEVIVLVDGFRSAGIHSMRFDARHLAGGVYFLRLLSGSGIQTHKMILLK